MVSEPAEDRVPRHMNDIEDDLELLVRSRYALIVLETPEEERADALLRHVATKLSIEPSLFAKAASTKCSSSTCLHPRCGVRSSRFI